MKTLDQQQSAGIVAVPETAPVAKPQVGPDLRTVAFPAEFAAGARNAVVTCLKIQPNEKVTLITDESCLEIAASLASELDRTGCEWNGFVLEQIAPRPLVGMPKAVLADM